MSSHSTTSDISARKRAEPFDSVRIALIMKSSVSLINIPHHPVLARCLGIFPSSKRRVCQPYTLVKGMPEEAINKRHSNDLHMVSLQGKAHFRNQLLCKLTAERYCLTPWNSHSGVTPQRTPTWEFSPTSLTRFLNYY